MLCSMIAHIVLCQFERFLQLGHDLLGNLVPVKGIIITHCNRPNHKDRCK
jgi:hypothetical protein